MFDIVGVNIALINRLLYSGKYYCTVFSFKSQNLNPSPFQKLKALQLSKPYLLEFITDVMRWKKFFNKKKRFYIYQTLSILLGIQFRKPYGPIKDIKPFIFLFFLNIFLAWHDPETQGVQEPILSLFKVHSLLTYGWKSVIFNRPGVAGAVLKSALSFNQSVSLFLLIFKIS